MIDRLSVAMLALCIAGVLTASVAAAFGGDDAGPSTPDAVVSALPAVATTTVTTEPTVGGVVQALRGGHWLIGLAGAVFLVVFVVRKFWSPETKTGKRILAVAVSVAVTGATAVYAGAPITVSLLLVVLSAAWMASGISEDVKDAAGR